MWRTHYTKDVGPSEHGKKVRLAGWVEDIRILGKIAFLIVRDRTATFQITLVKSKIPPAVFDAGVGLTRESVVSVDGLVQPNAQVRNGWELIPEKLNVLNAAAAPLPLGVVDRVNIDIDTRLDHRFMDLRRAEPRAIFRIRDGLVDAGRTFLHDEGFLEIHSSNIQGSSSEGGTDVFKFKYFEREAYLSQSPQLYKQMMMATGFDRVFEVARYFRAEKHNTVRHLNESTAFDLEMAFIENEEEVMSVIERLIQAIWKRVVEAHASDLEVLAKKVHVPSVPFLRIPYDEVVARLTKAGHKIAWGEDPGTEGERILGQLVHKENRDFYFITKWPLALKPFYCMPEDGTMDSRHARAFDLDYRGIELLSGAQRIHEPKLLEQGLVRCDLNPKDFEGYLEAFRYGMPPHGGCGIGIERLLMQMLELANIREATLFPRDRTRLKP